MQPGSSSTLYRSLDIGVGENPRAEINVDVVPSRYCNLVASAEYLPIRSSKIRKVYAMNVLEHLTNPKRALSEINRVCRPNAVIEIVIVKRPFSSPQRYLFFRFILNLPVSLLKAYHTMKACYQLQKRDPAQWFHYCFVEPEAIKKYLNILECREIDDLFLGWLNSGRKAKFFRKKPRLHSLYHLVCKPLAKVR